MAILCMPPSHESTTVHGTFEIVRVRTKKTGSELPYEVELGVLGVCVDRYGRRSDIFKVPSPAEEADEPSFAWEL